MENLEKRIQINENRILIYRVSKGYVKPTYTISEGFIENGELIKTYDLSQWDDYGFNGWVPNEDKVKNISFEFEMSHPLYFPLFHLLKYDDELLIDDDDTRENNKKYMLIRREKDKVYIDFKNEFTKNRHMTERFHVFIKNIVFDGRSKIDQNQKDTKIRLNNFFNEVNDILTKDYHQISIEEWALMNSAGSECKELKKVFKRKL
jgi:hypothetical protein